MLYVVTAINNNGTTIRTQTDNPSHVSSYQESIGWKIVNVEEKKPVSDVSSSYVRRVQLPYMGSYTPETGITSPGRTKGIEPIPEKKESSPLASLITIPVVSVVRLGGVMYGGKSASVTQVASTQPSPSLEPSVSFNDAYNNYSSQLDITHSNISYVQSLPSGSMVQFESGESVSREVALSRLKNQETTLVSNQSQIKTYQDQGYTIGVDESGNYVFSRDQQIESGYVDDSAERLRQAQEEYQSLGSVEQFGRALFAGTMFFLQPVYDALGGIISQGGLLSGGGILGVNPRTGVGAVKGVMESPENIILKESDIWNSAKSGDVSSFVVKTIMTPTVSDILIPFAGGAVAGKAFGVVGGIGSGAVKVTGAGASAIKNVASVYPWVAGGVFGGMAAGGVVATGVYEQHGLVPKGSTVEASLRLGTQFTSAGIGASWASDIKLPSFKKELIVFREPSTGMEYAYGRKYVDVFGRSVYYGKTLYGGARPLAPISETSIVPISKTSYNYLLPSAIKTSSGASGYLRYQQMFEAGKMQGGLFDAKELSTITDIYPPSEIGDFDYPKVYTPGEWKWADDIGFMQHKTDAKTFIAITEKGTKVFSVSDKTLFVGDVSKIDTNLPRDQYRFMIGGYSRTKVPSEYGRYSFIDRNVYGVVTSKELPVKESDITLFKSVGSFNVSSESFNKQFVMSDKPLPPREYSFGGRLFDETHITESIVSSKQFGGEVSKKGHFGLVTVNEPEYTLFVSKGMVNQINPVEAKGIAMVIKKQLDTNIDIFGGGVGGSLKTIPGLFSDISFGGGLTTQNEYPSLFEPQEVSVLTKGIRTSIVDISGSTDIVSSYWNDVKPNVNSYEKGVLMNTGLKPTDISKTGLTLGILSNTGFKTDTFIDTFSNQNIKNISGIKTESITDTISKTDKVTKIISINDTISKTDTKQQLKTVSITDAFTLINIPSIFAPPRTPSPPFTLIKFDFSSDFIEPITGGAKSFQVWVKPRQYVDGKKIEHPGKPYLLNSKGYFEDDAKAIGANKVGNTAKATFFLKPVDKKPSKRPRGVDSWYNVITQYTKKDDGRFVELSRFRINSPNEIREISMRGWKSSHKYKGRRH